MNQKRYSATAPVTASRTAPGTAIGSAVSKRIAYRIGRLVLMSSLIGGSFSLYSFLPTMAQPAAPTVAQSTNDSENDAEDTSDQAPAEAEAEESEAATEESESSDPTPSENRRSPLSTARPNLRVGSEGQAVAELQALLKLLGYYAGAVDGLYSEATADAVSEFQTAAGLTADGVVGPATWGKLLPAAPVASPTATANQPPDTAAVTVTDFPTPVLTPGDLASGTTPAETETDSSPAAATPNPVATPDSVSDTSDAADATDATADIPADSATEAELTPAPTATTSLPADESNPAAFPILRLGASGPAVERLQERLQSLGHYQGTIDGIFGERTQTAVRAAQQANQLSVDGVVGPATWEVLLD